MRKGFRFLLLLFACLVVLLPVTLCGCREDRARPTAGEEGAPATEPAGGAR